MIISNKKTLLILGHRGMLGHTVLDYFLSTEKYNIEVTDLKWPSIEFKTVIQNFDGDYIINGIGSIPQRKTDFDINSSLPIWLDENVKCKVIHPASDCEMDSTPYGISKKQASDYIKLLGKNTKSLKTSIIGYEIDSVSSLMEWFLNSTRTVYGYTNFLWNGVTTLTWAKECEKLINNWYDYKTETIISSECISKYQLLLYIKQIHNKDTEIEEDDTINENKCLIGDIQTPSIKIQLQELKDFYDRRSAQN